MEMTMRLTMSFRRFRGMLIGLGIATVFGDAKPSEDQ
jgi:hypothetical protein